MATYDDWERYIHPDDREKVETGRQAALGAGEPIDLEFRILTPAGEVRWLQLRGRGLEDGRGALARVVGVIIDVTARRRVEEALVESEADARSFFENMVDACAICEAGRRRPGRARRPPSGRGQPGLCPGALPAGRPDRRADGLHDPPDPAPRVARPLPRGQPAADVHPGRGALPGARPPVPRHGVPGPARSRGRRLPRHHRAAGCVGRTGKVQRSGFVASLAAGSRSPCRRPRRARPSSSPCRPQVPHPASAPG